jgi:hypothetical protein
MYFEKHPKQSFPPQTRLLRNTFEVSRTARGEADTGTFGKYNPFEQHQDAYPASPKRSTNQQDPTIPF